MDDVLTYLAFGDSITSGNNVHWSERYPTLLATYVEQLAQQRVFVRNLGKSGLTSTKLLRQLQNSRVRREMSRADLVTICIGGDDLLYGYLKWRLLNRPSYLPQSMKKLHRNMTAICHLLSAAAPFQCILGTFYNPFPNTPLAIEGVRHCNEQIIYPIATRFGFPVADLYGAFLGREHHLLDNYQSGFLEDYIPFTPHSPIHPNKAGYHVIADCFASRIFAF